MRDDILVHGVRSLAIKHSVLVSFQDIQGLVLMMCWCPRYHCNLNVS
jgi:hypothetical protein